VLIAIVVSVRNGIVGIGDVMCNIAGNGAYDGIIVKYFIVFGLRDEQNVCMTDLEVIAVVLRCMPDGL
jgi:hypothetical protein